MRPRLPPPPRRLRVIGFDDGPFERRTGAPVPLAGVVCANTRFNLIDLPHVAATCERPCVAVMRRVPNVAAMRNAIAQLPNAPERYELLERAGPIHQRGGFVFQAAGVAVNDAAEALARLTDTGGVPEALRIAHLIGSAIVLGESRGRA